MKIVPIKRSAVVWRIRQAARLVCVLVCLMAGPGSLPVFAQNDAWPMPARSPNPFGFPYPPPTPDEPGVTMTRRFMLDGVPELNFRLRAQDELWLVSSRELQRIDDPADKLVCKRARGDAWDTVPLSQLMQAHTDRPALRNLVFVHGNRTEDFWARRRGKQVYQATVGNHSSAPPTRFVIWAWPSDPIESVRPFEDFLQKQERTRVDGFWLGYYLSHLPVEADPVLITYSLGTQIGVTALTDLQAAGNRQRFRVLAVAPVTRCEWPCHEIELSVAAQSIRQLSLVRNKSDIAIRAFRKLCQMTTPDRTCSGVDMLAQHVPGTRQFDVSAEQGCEHNLAGYASLPVVSQELDRLSQETVPQTAHRTGLRR